MDTNEDIRLKEFRQLKREIRGSRDHLVIGIDIAKDRHHAFFGMPTGKTILRRFVFENTKEGFENLCFQTDTLKTRHVLKKIVFGLEPTSDYHKPLAEYLIRQGHTVVLVGGAAVKKNRELLDGRWDKNDTKDAANIADLVTQGKCLFYDFPSPDVRELRNLLSLKRKLKKQEQGYKVRIRNHLIAQYFPEMDSYFGYGEGPAIIKWCLDPAELSSLPFEEFVRMVSSRNGGEKQRRRLWEIYNKAASSIGCEATPGIFFEAKALLNELQQLHTIILETDKKIVDICKRFPEYAFLLSIPGFGPDISAKTLGPSAIPAGSTMEGRCLRWRDWILPPIGAVNAVMQLRSSQRRGKPIFVMASIRRRLLPLPEITILWPILPIRSKAEKRRRGYLPTGG